VYKKKGLDYQKFSTVEYNDRLASQVKLVTSTGKQPRGVQGQA